MRGDEDYGGDSVEGSTRESRVTTPRDSGVSSGEENARVLSDSKPTSYYFYYGPDEGNVKQWHRKEMVKDMSKSNNPSQDDDVISMDSTGKRKSIRRLLERFAEKTSMVGVPYINNAKFWWAKLIWCFCLLVAMCAMGLHLWYLFDQFLSWPKQTQIYLGFDSLDFPEVTICNTNIMHKGRLDAFNGAEELKALIEAMRPENIAPNQFDPNYDPFATQHPPGGDGSSGNGNPPSPGGQPAGPQTTQPAGQPAGPQTTKPAGQPAEPQTTQPAGQPTGSQTTQPAGQKTGSQTTQPAGQPTGSQTTQPAGQPTGSQTTQPAGQPTGSQTTQPARQPTGSQTTQPTRQPAGSRTTRPTRQPAGSRTTRPTRKPAGQPAGPNTRRKRNAEGYGNLDLNKFDKSGVDRKRDEQLGKDDFNGEVDVQTEINEIFSELYMDIPKHRRGTLGHNMEDMLISCTFSGRECQPNMFKRHQTVEYGNCWSINSKMFKSKKSGPIGGLTLVMFLEVGEYLKGITSGYGIRAQIHERGTYPYPAQEGMYIPSAMETDIGLRMNSIHRLDGNYGYCDKGVDFMEKYGLAYSRRACQTICFVEKVIDTCACFDNSAEEFSLKINETIKPCRSQREIDCLIRVTKRFDSEEHCTCGNPCDEVTYIKSTSQRQWPTEEYGMILLDSVCTRNKDVCKTLREKMDDKTFISNNFLKLNIYYEDLNFENVTEVPEIEVQQFLSDVGGAIGLWIGLSILSLCEVVQLFIELCKFGAQKTVSERQQRRKHHEKESAARRHGDRHTLNGDTWPNTEFGSNNSDQIKQNGVYSTHIYNDHSQHSTPNGEAMHGIRYHSYRDDNPYNRPLY